MGYGKWNGQNLTCGPVFSGFIFHPYPHVHEASMPGGAGGRLRPAARQDHGPGEDRDRKSPSQKAPARAPVGGFLEARRNSHPIFAGKEPKEHRNWAKQPNLCRIGQWCRWEQTILQVGCRDMSNMQILLVRLRGSGSSYRFCCNTKHYFSRFCISKHEVLRL